MRYKLIFLYHLGMESCLPKTTLEPKLAGGWARGASQKFWDPLLISATIEASNFKFGTQVGFGEWRTKKQHLGPKLAGVGLGEHLKNFGTIISATIEASNFKFSIQLRFGE